MYACVIFMSQTERFTLFEINDITYGHHTG